MNRLSISALAAGLLFSVSSAFIPGRSAATNSEAVQASSPAVSASVASAPATNTPTTTAAPSVAKPAPKDDDDDDSDGLVLNVGNGRHHDSQFVEDFVPLVAIVATFATPILIVFCITYFRYRRRQETLATVREYVSKGLPVPPEILTAGDFRRGETPQDLMTPVNAGRCDTRRGLKLIFIGAAISVGLYFLSSHHHGWASGLIVMVIGLGYLVVGWFEMNEDKKNARPPGSPL